MWKTILVRIAFGVLGLVLGLGLGICGLYICGNMGLFYFTLDPTQEIYGLYWAPILLIGFPLLGAVLGVIVRRFYKGWIVWISVTLLLFGYFLLKNSL